MKERERGGGGKKGEREQKVNRRGKKRVQSMIDYESTKYACNSAVHERYNVIVCTLLFLEATGQKPCTCT